jgi:hypothetical protein
MRGLTAWVLWLLLASPAVGQGQDEEPPPASPPATESEPEQEAVEAVSGEDVWAAGEADEEEVFVPSETVSADSAIAFPADI